MKHSDKNKWFEAVSGERIFCTMDDLTDLLTIIFRGDWQRAKNTAKQFHPIINSNI